MQKQVRHLEAKRMAVIQTLVIAFSSFELFWVHFQNLSQNKIKSVTEYHIWSLIRAQSLTLSKSFHFQKKTEKSVSFQTVLEEGSQLYRAAHKRNWSNFIAYIEYHIWCGPGPKSVLNSFPFQKGEQIISLSKQSVRRGLNSTGQHTNQIGPPHLLSSHKNIYFV